MRTEKENIFLASIEMTEAYLSVAQSKRKRKEQTTLASRIENNFFS
jgi:hypothetical protein